MTTTEEKISTTDKLIAAIELRKSKLAGGAYIKGVRDKALESFVKQGLPNKKKEEYKYSQLEKLFKADFIQESNLVKYTPRSIEKLLIPDLNATIVVLVNGIFFEEFSTLSNGADSGLIISSFTTALEKNPNIIEKHFAKYADINSDPFIAMNTALAGDGVFLYLPDNANIDRPLHIINIITTKDVDLISTRNLFVIGKNSSISIVETFSTFVPKVHIVNNIITEIVVGENAKVQYYKLQNEYDNPSPSTDPWQGSHYINTTQVYQHANSHFDTNTVTLNGSWIRNNLNIVPDGSNCETHLNGLFITQGTQHVDNHTLVDHRVANCQSNQLYKGILNDKSTGVFNGKIFVRRDAQKTNAYQSSKNILLSDNATINTKPQLEIYADDVKCSHGSSTGQIDQEAVFYLRSRGLNEHSAKNLLMYAFAADVVNTIQIEALRNYLHELIQNRLSHNA